MLLPTLPTLLLRLLPAVVTLKSHDDFTRQSLISLSKITLHSSLRAISLSSMMTLLSLCLRRARCSFAIHDSFISGHFKRQTPIGLDRSVHPDRVSLTQQPLQSKHQNKSIGVLCCTGTVVVTRVVVVAAALHCRHISRIAVVTRAHLDLLLFNFFLLLLLLLFFFLFIFAMQMHSVGARTNWNN